MVGRQANNDQANWRFTESKANAGGGEVGFKPLKVPKWELDGKFEDHPNCQSDRLPSYGYLPISKVRSLRR